MRVIKAFLAVITVCLLIIPLKVFAVAGPCTLCIVEVQTQGLAGASEEYVVIANNSTTTYDLGGVSLRYRTASNNIGGTIALSGNLAGHATKMFVSTSLKDANPAAIVLNFGLADAGGTLQLIKSGQTELLDQVGWGTATSHDGVAAPTHERGWSLVRSRVMDGTFTDTNDNANNFDLVKHACLGLSINEIQPFLVSSDGYDLDQTLELLKDANAATDQDCPLLVNGVVLAISSDDLGNGAGLVVVNNLNNATGQTVPLDLHTDAANSFQFMPRSATAAVAIPGAILTQPILLPNQSYSKFSTVFKATYKPTPGTSNQLQTTPLLVPDSTPPIIVDKCGDIIVNELLPNPLGDDTGHEWAEFSNTTDHSVPLAGCILQVNGTQYAFASDQFISPDQYLVLDSFSDGTSAHSLSLRNSGTNTVSFGHLNATTGAFEALQTVQYIDAPEGSSWARFDDGWRWTVPTPGFENSLQSSSPSASEPQPTEFAALTTADGTKNPDPGNSGNPTDPATTPLPTSAVISITELLPNPAAPVTDDIGEFVELYNPSSQEINLSGYKLQTGSNYTYSFTFTGGSLLPHTFDTFYSRDTNLVLSNTGGRARLLDPNGQVVSESGAYTDAAEGVAWALIDGLWQWTIAPTPGKENVASIPLLGTPKSTSLPKSTSSKTSTSAKVLTAKATPKAATSSKASAVKAAKTTAAKDRQTYKDPAQLPPSIHSGILVGVGVITLLYAAYEYRNDAFNAFRRFKRYRTFRRTTGAQSSGR